MSQAIKLALIPLLLAQAALTRRRLPRLPEADGPRRGETGQGPLLRLLIAGDSSAAGVGVVSQREALAGRLSERLAATCSARVAWQLVARSGMTTAQTLQLLRQESPPPADVAVVVTGVNDLIEQIPAPRAIGAREAIASHLRDVQCVRHVVFAPLPPVHDLPGLPQPLRWVSGADARRHNAALRRWVQGQADVSSVDMGQLSLHRGVMASDGFHPGEPVYRYCAAAIAQHIATTVWPRIRQETTT